jgi:zinc transport system permease protein
MNLDILQYSFMQRAFLVGILLAVIIPCIGVIVVFKRLSLIGDALSHTSLAGVALGLIFGINPIVGAMAASLLAAFSIEAIRKKIPKYSELSIAIVLSVGVGLAGVLSGFVKNAANFNSFLFGSIVAISDFETGLVVGISILVFLAFILLYKELFYIAFDEQAAELSGVPVKLVNTIFTVLTAITVSVASRTVGALIVSSLMVVPVATAMVMARSYKQTVIGAIICAVAATIIGLIVSYYAEIKPGGTIVLTAVALFLLALLIKQLHKMIRSAKMKGETNESA